MTQTREELRAAIDTAVHQAAMHYEDAGTIGGQRAAVSDAVCTIMALIPEAPASTLIACSDAMPEYDKRVLVCNEEFGNQWVDCYRQGSSMLSGSMRSMADNWVLEWHDVTHWQPLPAPPAEEE
jgi:hypothetical protein